MPWSLVLDALVAVLLAACIAAAVILERRLASLRADRSELEKLMRDFQDATDRAGHGVSGLKVSAQALQERIDTARALAEDLQFLIERGGAAADRLENEIRAARRQEARTRTPSPGTSASGSAPARSGAPPRSAAELHLIKSMRAAQG